MILRRFQNTSQLWECWVVFDKKTEQRTVISKDSTIQRALELYSEKCFAYIKSYNKDEYKICWQKEYNSIEEIKEDIPEEFI